MITTSFCRSALPSLRSVGRGRVLQQRNLVATTKSIFRRENIPYFGLFVGACALGFQTLVLHPWHDRLSDQFDQLEVRIHKLDAFAEQLSAKMDEVVKLEEEVKVKEIRCLDSSNAILTKIEQTESKIQSLVNTVQSTTTPKTTTRH